MKTTAAILVLLLAITGCASSPCEDALTAVQDCGFEDAELTPDGEECEAKAACEAECVVASTCDEITGALVGDVNDLVVCIEDCS